MKLAECAHLEAVDTAARPPVAPRTPGCEECLAMGASWFHLRLCMACGHVGCCNDSPNRHASAHFRQCGHGVIRSYEPGESWAYCYADDSFVPSIASMPGEAPARHLSPPEPAGA